ncbi:hypothetical protein WP7S18C02_16110 [Klebsiella sp. WP7-S18-CRE-02]|nr:hypothetical protein WP3W18E02_16000 [Klebsiella sp. WP3-W18-ESBL-02]BBR20104.1 hypothetical protein WP3S18E05_15840 [Klebsiella sp. WP3-S18-ESBL-05]BBR59669.1 hypothetical protein WP4W18E05_30370 [Klebsiella sp. WP4-W18-ESBL-05]BBS90996.1 hypothetical protein WP7S18C02_16110 [Klebsiella sp. WP7-S18-CRE-02]BBS96019.1 hypothetical protein WP7S18C03_16120 [Klebsiella sp. WP7-S18-CRE-03]BBT01049.1 hypothetical protein WP7S18E04_16110 [Klebsiella sp. WP7-S18-ESBL-04]
MRRFSLLVNKTMFRKILYILALLCLVLIFAIGCIAIAWLMTHTR